MGQVNIGTLWTDKPDESKKMKSLFRDGLNPKKSTDYENKNHDIIGVEFVISKNYGEVAIVEVENHDAYMTTSKTLKKQLRIIENTLKTGVKSVGVRLVRLKSNKSANRYMLYVDPE